MSGFWMKIPAKLGLSGLQYNTVLEQKVFILNNSRQVFVGISDDPDPSGADSYINCISFEFMVHSTDILKLLSFLPLTSEAIEAKVLHVLNSPVP